MRLDELIWIPLNSRGTKVARLRRPKDLEIGSIYWINDELGYSIVIHGVTKWQYLDAFTAQCLLYNLLGNSPVT